MAAHVCSLTPNSLYSITIKVLSNNFVNCSVEKLLSTLPAHIIFDLWQQLLNDNDNWVAIIIGNLDIFMKLFQLTGYRINLHRGFQKLEDQATAVSRMLTSVYITRASKCCNDECQSLRNKLDVIDTGIKLGTFLADAAWYENAEKVLTTCRGVCETLDGSAYHKRLHLECVHHLLRVQATFCNLTGAEETCNTLNNLIVQLMSINDLPNLSGVYTNFSFYYFVRNEFHKSYDYCIKALAQLSENLPPKTLIDTLRQAARSCVMKRKFQKARALILQAVNMAADVFGTLHPKYGDTLLDYGFFLLNNDSIAESVRVYELALMIKTSVFGQDNIHIGVALEDLSYALYVHEYSTGRFTRAQLLVQRAIDVMTKLLPAEHIMLSSAQRVKALILEEIAIDNPGQNNLLNQAEKLHLKALKLSQQAFGEMNVQTAKHYGNLGRLYQSMQQFEEAERMHLKAISIKETLLGCDDYEVGLSVGHLASLYNYHMGEYEKASELYLRSIDISLKLFGKSYSGLEYDYRGLVHVYRHLQNPAKVAEYHVLLEVWKELREAQTKSNVTMTSLEAPRPISDVIADVIGPAH